MASNIDASLINFQLIKPALAQLTDLLTITDTLVDQYYNIFLNPTPIEEVEIKVYGSSGNIQTINVPNLAYLRQICTIGTGSPEGYVEAPVGSFYLDIQTGQEPSLYIKTGELVTPVTNTDWLELSTITDINNAIDQLNQYQQQVDEMLNQAMLTTVSRVFPDYANVDTATYSALNTQYTLTDTGWVELSNSSNSISVTISTFNGTGEPTIDRVLANVGNYVMLPMTSGTMFTVTTAGTNIAFYPVLYQE